MVIAVVTMHVLIHRLLELEHFFTSFSTRGVHIFFGNVSADDICMFFLLLTYPLGCHGIPVVLGSNSKTLFTNL